MNSAWSIALSNLAVTVPPLPLDECKQCGKHYTATSPRQFYCCSRCQMDAKNESRRVNGRKDWQPKGVKK